jgi:hypothetical protein
MTRPRSPASVRDSEPPTTRRCGRGSVRSCGVLAYDQRQFEVRPSQPITIVELVKLREASHPEKVFIPGPPPLPRPRGLRRGGREYDETPTTRETPLARRRAIRSGHAI